jgi:tellurite resistance protein TerA
MEEVTLKKKVTLKRKGDSVEVATFGKMVVTLNWTLEKVGVDENGKDVFGPDFDLMAYYKTKDGTEGGICSSGYNQNKADMGYLDKFPWMQLDQDDKPEDNSKAGDPANEEMKISKLDDFDEVYICVINYEDALEGNPATFGKYNGFISVVTDSTNGENNFEIPLDSMDSGHVALVCKIVNTSGKPRLINENTVMSLGKFSTAVPGAKLILE